MTVARTSGAVGVCALGAASCAAQEQGAFDPEGPAAAELNWLFWSMTTAGALVLALVLILLVRARRGSRSDTDPDRAERRSTRLVVGGGIVLPIVVLVPLAITMLVVADRLAPRQGDAYEILVVGHRYWWEVVYPDAGVVTANEIHVPADTRVRFVLETRDVIHSFWAPQLGGKIDMIPGETTELVLEADEPGWFLGQCAEFCGIQHARMRFHVVAQPRHEFDEWLAAMSAPAAPPASPAAARGADAFVALGCAGCHSVRGISARGGIGPDLTHLASRAMLGAGTVLNDRGQLGGWIADPHGVKPGVEMPPTPLTPEKLHDLIAFLEGLR